MIKMLIFIPFLSDVHFRRYGIISMFKTYVVTTIGFTLIGCCGRTHIPKSLNVSGQREILNLSALNSFFYHFSHVVCAVNFFMILVVNLPFYKLFFFLLDMLLLLPLFTMRLYILNRRFFFFIFFFFFIPFEETIKYFNILAIQ